MVLAEEYRARRDALRALLATHGLSAYVAASTDAIFYLTGAVFVPIERPVLLVVRVEGAPVVVAPLLERDHIGAQIPDAELLIYRDYPSPAGEMWQDRLADTVGGLSAIAVDPYARAEVAGVLGAAGQVRDLVEQLRLVKSPTEIACIRRAAHHSDAQVAAMRREIIVGRTVADVYGAIGNVTAAAAAELGPRFNMFTTACMSLPWAAPFNAEPHRIPAMTDRFDADGPHNMTAMARFDGYAAESERVLFLTRPSAEVAAAHRAVCAARELAWSMLRPGRPAAEVDAAVRDHFRREGFGDYLLHRTGHGFGLGAHEGPWLAEGSSDILAEGMVVSIEPGLYLPGIGGIRDSDTILITAAGCEVLTAELYERPFAKAA